MAARKYTEQQRLAFMALIDQGGSVRAAAVAVGVHPDVGYRWMKQAGLSTPRSTQRRYTPEEQSRATPQHGRPGQSRRGRSVMSHIMSHTFGTAIPAVDMLLIKPSLWDQGRRRRPGTRWTDPGHDTREGSGDSGVTTLVGVIGTNPASQPQASHHEDLQAVQLRQWPPEDGAPTSVLERLPGWVTSAKHRSDVIRAIERLQERIPR